MQLNDVEYKILKFINTIKNTHGINLKELFPENEFLVSSSLEILDKLRLIESESVVIPNKNSSGKTIFTAKKITNEGKKALYEYEKNQQLLKLKEQKDTEREKKMDLQFKITILFTLVNTLCVIYSIANKL